MKKSKVIITVKGGVAEVRECPENIEIEIRDYDTDGCDQTLLEKDGSVVKIYEKARYKCAICDEILSPDEFREHFRSHSSAIDSSDYDPSDYVNPI